MFRPKVFAHPQDRKLLLVGGLERCDTEYVFGVKDAARVGVKNAARVGVKDADNERHPSHRTHSPCRSAPDHRPTTIWVSYTTCCKSQSCAPEDEQKLLPETR